MRRCPRCEFIYENDQRVCDMDGEPLVAYATAALPPPESLAPARQPAEPRGTRRRVFAALLAAGAVSAATLLLVRHAPAGHAPLPVAARPDAATRVAASPPLEPARAPQPPAENAPVAPPPERAPHAPVAEATRRAASAVNVAPQRTRRAAHGSAETPGQEAKGSAPESADVKKGSSLGSFLKKTGRALKKPFKL